MGGDTMRGGGGGNASANAYNPFEEFRLQLLYGFLKGLEALGVVFSKPWHLRKASSHGSREQLPKGSYVVPFWGLLCFCGKEF